MSMVGGDALQQGGGHSSGKPTKPARSRSTEKILPATRKSSRKPSLTTLIACGWFALLLAIIVAAKFLWPTEPAENIRLSASEAASQLPPPVAEAEDNKLLNDEGQSALEAFSRFLSSSTPEERNQYVLHPLQTAVKMDRFYRENSMPKLDPADFNQKNVEVLHFPDGERGFYSLWEHRNGQFFDSLMRKEDGEWKIDWEHFVRYASEPFSMFISGNGDAEGEFRLLVRERLAEERKGLDSMSLVFYTPRFGRPQEEGQESPEIRVSRSSPEGKLLSSALKNATQGGKVFFSRINTMDPDRMARVRVLLRRSGADTERSFHVARVLACHWFSDEHPGLEPESPKP